MPKCIVAAIFLSVFVARSIEAQTLPQEQLTTDSLAVKKKHAANYVKTNNASNKTTNTSVIKFLCDADATLYIDGDKKGELQKDVVFRISISKGEYQLKAFSSANENDIIKEKYVVLDTGTEKLVEISLQQVISNRLNAAASISESEKQKHSDADAGKKGITDPFLLANMNNPGVVTLPSGLQYSISKITTGPQPDLKDKVKINYILTLSNGTLIENSFDKGGPLEVQINSILLGLKEALLRMHVGDKWKLFIPPGLGYGNSAAGVIPARSVLIFELELVEISK